MTETNKKQKEIVLPERLWDKYSPVGNCRHKDLISAIYRMIEIKDMHTANHCKAVAYYSDCVGRAAGFKTDDLKILKEAALLHDIGKMMVDLCVINKKGKLNDREKLQMQCHPANGMITLESFHLDDRVVDAAWHHHERWDGGGYPDGLSGEYIPDFTRIICVCDALDAMSSNRPYRRANTKDFILEELTKEAGSQFDPTYAEITHELVKSGGIKLVG